MPGRLQAFRELPGDIQRLTMLATLALTVSVVAIIIALGSKHAYA